MTLPWHSRGTSRGTRGTRVTRVIFPLLCSVSVRLLDYLPTIRPFVEVCNRFGTWNPSLEVSQTIHNHTPGSPGSTHDLQISVTLPKSCVAIHSVMELVRNHLFSAVLSSDFSLDFSAIFILSQKTTFSRHRFQASMLLLEPLLTSSTILHLHRSM